LIPIANSALIEYVIDFLTSNGVEEIFFFSRVHRKQINDYINSQNYREIKTQYLQSSTASNMGDVLREINDIMIIDEHFLLVSGDIVSNISF
jgi:NDP-sugar pyrophosphorylase family protein